MNGLRYWLQYICSCPSEHWWLDFNFFNDADSISFDVSKVSKINFEINGRNVLPCEDIAGLREFCDLMEGEDLLISFSGNRITFLASDAMKKNHITIRVLCPKKTNLKVYQSVTMSL